MRPYPGVVTGTVTNLEDPAGEGRIQVKFPWLDRAYRSEWAPVATPLAGRERGMYFMPEIDDEVLLAFDQGHFDHPFIIGFLWNGVDVPPETGNENRIIKTPGGHTLRFEDGDHGKKIHLESSSGHKIILDDSFSSARIKIESNGNQDIELNGGGRSLVLSGGQVKIS